MQRCRFPATRGVALTGLLLATLYSAPTPAEDSDPDLALDPDHDPASDVDPDEADPAQAIRRGHRVGTTGLVMTGLAAPLILAGVGMLDSASTFPDYFGGAMLVGSGAVSATYGPIALAASSFRNGERLRALEPEHSKVAGGIALGSVAGAILYPMFTADTAFSGTEAHAVLFAAIGSGVVVGGTVQYGLNLRAARVHGVLPTKQERFTDVRVVPSTTGVALAGRF